MFEKEDIADDYMILCKNLHVLHNRTLELPKFPDRIIIGSTLWSNIPADKHGLIYDTMNDCKQIIYEKNRVFDVQTWNNVHLRNVRWLEQELAVAHTANKRVLVVTHHLPSFNMILPQHKDSPMNCAFATDMDRYIMYPCVKAWICGHSHGQQDGLFSLQDRHVIVTFNARGYPMESSNETYNPSKVLDI
jgi:3',5'-cyclic AMP phosphodiesterase CpdA